MTAPCLALVVDDDADSAYVFTHILEHAGCEVHYVATAQLAFEYMVASLPDVILMDFRLPDMNGWDATRQLRADPRTAHIPVIATTAYDLVDIETQARDAGVSSFLPKPTDPFMIVTEVQRLLPHCELVDTRANGRMMREQ